MKRTRGDQLIVKISLIKDFHLATGGVSARIKVQLARAHWQKLKMLGLSEILEGPKPIASERPQKPSHYAEKRLNV